MTRAPSSWARRARGALRGERGRAGGARDAVIGLLAGQDCAVSAQEIGERLGAEGRPVGTASVYRVLDALHDAALVRKIELGDGGARYEATLPDGEHHHHAVCDRCGAVTPFEDERLEAAIERIEDRLPHEVSSHEVVVRGVCPRCGRREGAQA